MSSDMSSPVDPPSTDNVVVPFYQQPPPPSPDKDENDKVRNLMLRYCDERDEIQKKTFTKWMNRYLMQSGCRVNDLYEDLRDGNNLISLLEVLTKVKLRRERGLLRIHRLQNVNTALDYLVNDKKIKLVNIRSDDIVDGNPKLTLGLIWTIILSLQIQDIVVMNEEGEDVSAKAGLLVWAQRHMEGYDDINVTNFTTSWKDGKVFSAIINRHRPDLIDMSKLDGRSNYENLSEAFMIAEQELGVEPLLDPEDVDLEQPDERSIITYVSALFDKFPQVPPKPQRVTYRLEYVEKHERFTIKLEKLEEWIVTSSQLDCVINHNDAITTQQEFDDVINKLDDFRKNQLRNKTKELEELRKELKNLKEVQIKMKENGEEIDDQVDLLEDKINKIQIQLDDMTSQCDEKSNKISIHFHKLKARKERETKKKNFDEKLLKFQRENLKEFFMPYTKHENDEEIEKLQSLNEKLDLLRSEALMTSSNVTSQHDDDTSSSSSSGSDDDDDVTMSKRINSIESNIIDRISMLEKGNEILLEISTRCRQIREWMTSSDRKLRRRDYDGDVTNNQQQQDDDDDVIMMEEIVGEVKKCEKIFSTCDKYVRIAQDDYDVTPTDDVTMQVYRSKCEARLESLQQEPNELMSELSEMKMKMEHLRALQHEMEMAACKDREQFVVRCCEIIEKYQTSIREQSHHKNNLSEIEHQIKIFKKLDDEVAGNETSFSSMLDKIDDVTLKVSDVTTTDVITTRLLKLLDDESADVEEITTRWRCCKLAVKEKLKWLLVGRAKLLFINGECEQHGKWLKQQNIKLDEIKQEKVNESSLEQLKKFRSCVDIRLGKVENLKENFEQLVEAAVSFHQTCDNDVINDENAEKEIKENFSNVENKINSLSCDARLMLESCDVMVSDDVTKLKEEREAKMKVMTSSFACLRHNEQKLAKILPFPTRVDEIDEFLTCLKEVQENIEENDELFEDELEKKFESNMETTLFDLQTDHASFEQVDGIDEEMLNDLQTVSVAHMYERWRVLRNQIQPRMKLLSCGRIELEGLLNEISTHEDWIGENCERSTIRIHVNAGKINSKLLQQEIDRFKEFENEVKDRIGKEGNELSEKWKQLWRKCGEYDLLGYKQVCHVEESENLHQLCEDAHHTRKLIIYKQVSEILSSYEEQLKLIKSNLERLKNLKEKSCKREMTSFINCYKLLRHNEKVVEKHDVSCLMTSSRMKRARDEMTSLLEDVTSRDARAVTRMEEDCLDHVTKLSSLYDDVTVHVSVDDVITRWEANKLQVEKRLEIIGSNEPLLKEICEKLDQHQNWLEKNEKKIEKLKQEDEENEKIRKKSNSSSDSDESSSSSDEVDSISEEDSKRKNNNKNNDVIIDVEKEKKIANEAEKMLKEISSRLSDSGELLEKKLKFDENCEKYEKLCDCDVINRDDSSDDDDDDDDVITREVDDEARNLTSEVAEVINRYNEMKVVTSRAKERSLARHHMMTSHLHDVITKCLRAVNDVEVLMTSSPQHRAMSTDCDVIEDVRRELTSHREDECDVIGLMTSNFPHQHLTFASYLNHDDVNDEVCMTSSSHHHQLQQTPNDLATRWRKLLQFKQQRIELCEKSRSKLLELKPEVENHASWLSEHENDDVSFYEEGDCDVMNEKLKQMKQLSKEVKSRLENSRLMFQLSGEFDEFARKYFLMTQLISNSNHDNDDDDEAKMRMNFVEGPVKEIVRRYEEMFKKLQNSCKKQQEIIQIIKLQEIDDARIAEEKEKLLREWIEDKMKEIEAWNIEGGSKSCIEKQLNIAQNLEEELDEKKGELISLVGVVGVVSDNPHEMGKKFNLLNQALTDKKEKLEEMFHEAEMFEINFSTFQSWLVSAENYLKKERERAIKLNEEDLTDRFNDIKRFEDDVNSKRSDLLQLEQLASKIRYFANRQDSLQVKNKMLSLKGRWDKLVPNSNELYNLLSNILKLLQKYMDEGEELIRWCEQTGYDVTNKCRQPDSLNHDVILQYIATHDAYVDEMKERKSDLDDVIKMGKQLQEKSTIRDEVEGIKNKNEQIRNMWSNMEDDVRMARDNVDEWAGFSQHLYSVIDSLRSWLNETTEELKEEDGRCDGDAETVSTLINIHQKIKSQLTARCENLETIKLTIDEHKKDDEWSKLEIVKLSDLWDQVAELIRKRQIKLDEAYDQAVKLEEDCENFMMRVQHISQQAEDILTSNLPHNTSLHHTKQMELIHQQNVEELEKEKEVLFELNENITDLLEKAHPRAINVLQNLLSKLENNYEQANKLNDKVEEKLKQEKENQLKLLRRIDKFHEWLEIVGQNLKDQPLDCPNDQLDRLYLEHQDLQKKLTESQGEYDLLVTSSKNNHSNLLRHQPNKKKNNNQDDTSSISSSSSSSSCSSSGNDVTKQHDDKIQKLQILWQRVWFAALERQKFLEDAKDNRRKNLSPEEEAAERKFFEDWRMRYMKWKKNRKLRVMDLFRSVDSDQTGRLTHQQFINNIIKSSFRTTRAEMERVCGIFDKDGDGFIDYYEFISALYPNKENNNNNADDDEYVEDEVCRQVSSCKCCKKYFVERVKVNKVNNGNKTGLMFQYRFGESHQMRLVRVLSSVVMVRIGGGWQALEEFLQKNDPCRAKGRTNVEIHDKMILPPGASQSMTPFKRNRRSHQPQTSPAASPTPRNPRRSVPASTKSPMTSRMTPPRTSMSKK